MSMTGLTRKPPIAVRRELRSEVLFGCPVTGCGNPYLEYHHFDPQWHVLNHHNPKGMIALCATHHAKADAFTIEQCRALKANSHTRKVGGKFDWMRREIVAIVGGNYYYETPNAVVYHGQPVVWFDRDINGYMLLSLNMLTTSREPRTRLIANDWEIQGNPEDVESPPNGRVPKIRYANEDFLQIEFKKWPSQKAITTAHPDLENLSHQVSYPLVTAEIAMIVGGTNIRFDSKGTTSPSGFAIGCVVQHCRTGLDIANWNSGFSHMRLGGL